MKKAIAIIMAFVMIMAVTVPVFAAETTQYVEMDNPVADANGAQSSSVDVLTTYEDKHWDYTITIPAGFSFNWDDTVAKDANYSVDSHLLIGASLKVAVSADNDGKMTNSEITDYSLTYTLTGGIDEKIFGEINNAEGPDEDIKIAIEQEEYDNAVPAAYEGTVTYTVTYVPPTV